MSFDLLVRYVYDYVYIMISRVLICTSAQSHMSRLGLPGSMSSFEPPRLKVNHVYVYIYIYMYTHTHACVYIYIYI